MPRSAGHVQGPDGRARGRPRPCGVRGLQLCSKLRRVRVRSNGSPGLPAGEHAKRDRATNAQSRIADLTRRSYRFHPPPQHDRRYLSGQVEGICVGAGSPRAASARETNCFRLPQSELAEEEEATTSSRAEEESATGGGGGRTRKKRNAGNPNKWRQVSPRRMEPTDISPDRHRRLIRPPSDPAQKTQVAPASRVVGWPPSPDLRSATQCDWFEPDYTSAHRRFLGTVDYIWHTPSFRPLSALLPVPWEVLSRYYGEVCPTSGGQATTCPSAVTSFGLGRRLLSGRMGITAEHGT